MSPLTRTERHRAIPSRRSARRACRRALAVAALAAAALTGACAPPRSDDLYGVALDVRSQQPWTADPELRQRIHALLEDTCEHIGLDPSLLYGMTLRIEDGEIACGAVARARGCTWRDQGVIAVSTLAWLSTSPRVSCIEDTPIPHELLHVKIADQDHADPRWESGEFWRPLRDRVRHPECGRDAPTLIW